MVHAYGVGTSRRQYSAGISRVARYDLPVRGDTATATAEGGSPLGVMVKQRSWSRAEDRPRRPAVCRVCAARSQSAGGVQKSPARTWRCNLPNIAPCSGHGRSLTHSRTSRTQPLASFTRLQLPTASTATTTTCSPPPVRPPGHASQPVFDSLPSRPREVSTHEEGLLG